MQSIAADLEAGVSALARARIDELPIAALQDLIASVSVSVTRLQGVVARAVAELEVRGGGLTPEAEGKMIPTAAWLRGMAHVSGRTAGARIRTSLALRELPAVADAVVDGVLTLEHARVLTRLVGKIDGQQLLESQPSLIEAARQTDPEQLGHLVRHWIATWCEPAIEADEDAAHKRRFLQMVNKHNGSWRGRFELPDGDAEILLTVLEALAGGRDSRTTGAPASAVLTR